MHEKPGTVCPLAFKLFKASGSSHSTQSRERCVCRCANYLMLMPYYRACNGYGHNCSHGYQLCEQHPSGNGSLGGTNTGNSLPTSRRPHG